MKKIFLFVGVVAVVAALWFTQYRRMQSTTSRDFKVGFLPVTCHLTCPVTDYINQQLRNVRGLYEPIRFNGFPEMKEAFISKRLNATFIIAPLAMKMREQGVPIKIVYLGHRDGTTLMVHNDSNIRDIKDLEGKKIAIPSYYSNQHLILFRTFKKNGLKYDKNLLIEMPPPEMPTSLATKQVDAIIAGEPLMAKTEMEGYGRVLFMTKDVWPEFISCVLAVQEDEIKNNRSHVEDLVTGIARSGKWLDSDKADAEPNHRTLAAEVASRQQYFNQKPELIKFVLSKPPDRVKYTNLALQKENFAEIEALGREAGIFDGTLKFEDYTDTSFVPSEAEINPWVYEAESK